MTTFLSYGLKWKNNFYYIFFIFTVIVRFFMFLTVTNLKLNSYLPRFVISNLINPRVPKFI